MAANLPPHAAPDSLDCVLNSLQSLLDHSRHRPHHVLSAPLQSLPEPFSNQPAEQYDDPLILDDEAPGPVGQLMQQDIPVLRDVISPLEELHSQNAPSTADIEHTLSELRAELGGIVADVILDAREHLQRQEASSQEIMETGLKHFLHDLTLRLPR